MIRIGKFDYNPARGSMEVRRPEEKNANQIFLEVKRARHDLIRAHSITDAELKKIISSVKSGTRNTMYLAPDKDWTRLHDIAAYIVREYSYDH